MFVFVLQLRHMFEGQSEFYLFAFFSDHHLGVVAAQGAAVTALQALHRRVPRHHERGHSRRRRAARPVPRRAHAHRRAAARRGHRRHQRRRQPGARRRSATSSLPWSAGSTRPIPGKRNAVKIGTEMSRGEITVLRRLRHRLDRRHAARAGQAVRRPVRRRRDHPAADPRARAVLDHPLGRLAREHPRALLDARAVRARPGRLPAGPHHRVPPAHPHAGHGRLHAPRSSWASSSRSPTTARSPTSRSRPATGPCTSTRASSTPTPRCR